MFKSDENREKLQRFLGLFLIGIIYITIFSLLERRHVRVHILHTRFDDLIPFCRYFIIPYLLWFLYVPATVLWLGIFHYKENEFELMMRNLLVGMIIFMTISAVYPNGHYLRPYTYERDILSRMVRILYRIDTSTNVLPSLHVYNSMVCLIAILRNAPEKHGKLLKTGAGILTVLIVLATMFLKQHTVIDVATAFLFNYLCYNMVYVSEEEKAWGGSESEKHAHTR